MEQPFQKTFIIGKYKVSEVRPPAGYAISRQVFEANLSKTEPEKEILVRNQKNASVHQKSNRNGRSRR